MKIELVINNDPRVTAAMENYYSNKNEALLILAIKLMCGEEVEDEI